MPPPASFITISSAPFNQVVTQAMFNVANVQWFKYTATVPIVIGLQTNKGGTFVPRTTVFKSDGTTIHSPASTGDSGRWTALKIAGDYYIKVARQPSSTSDFDFTFTFDTRPLDTISPAPGDIIVNDDTFATGPVYIPAIVVSSTGVVRFFASGVPAGEFGAILPSNVSFWCDAYGQHGTTTPISIFDANLNLIGAVSCNSTSGDQIVFAVDILHNKVYVINESSELWTISAAGVPANTGYVFPLVGPFPEVMAVDPTGTILYWANVHNNINGIHRLNLSTLTPLSDLYTIPGFISGTDKIARTPNNHPGDMFVMPNGNIVTWWFSDATAIFHLIVLNSSGTLLYNYDYSDPGNLVSPGHALDHLAYINGDSNHVMGWWYTDPFYSIGRYGRLNLTTGVIDQIFDLDMFSQGFNSHATDKFGPSNSCTMLMFQAGVIPPPVLDLGGIYFINPIKATNHDTYYDTSTVPAGSVEKKIPDPTMKTGVLGE